MTQVYNFSAGPAVLPRDVLLQAQQELLDWHGSGTMANCDSAPPCKNSTL